MSKLKEGTIEKIIGVLIVIFVILIAVAIKSKMSSSNVNSNLTDVYVATGGGKEDFISDSDIINIMEEKYGLNVVYDTWSNGKTVSVPLVREYVGKGNSSLSEHSWSVKSDQCSKYDALFTSDERFYNYYKLSPSNDEADRYTVLDGSLTLNTPIVIYSWKEVADALINESIVTKKDDVYYITDMNKLLNYILEGKTWSDIGLNSIYGKININSTDPVTSSPGATYYGLLLSIMTGGDLSENKVNETLPKLKEFYTKSGYMNNTPADLFELYLKTGLGGKPMIVDYEKSIVELASSDKDAYDAVKDDIVILYPTPTIWNSHCIATFSDNGNKFLKAFDDKELQSIAWKKYGFRVGTTGGSYYVKDAGISGIPQNITSVASGLKMDVYNQIIDYLSN